MKWITRCIQVIFIAIPITVFGWLCVQNFVPSGVFIIKHSVHDSSPFIEALMTNERVHPPQKDAEGNWSQEIFADPVFFFVHPHIQFDSIEASVWFKNEGTPIVEFGALATKNPERYLLQPLQNLMIDESTWSRISDGGTVLLQRTANYQSISDFLSVPPALNEIATYQYDVQTPFRIAKYTPTSARQIVPVSFRGAQQMKTYVKDEVLNFSFTYTDMNRDAGSDPIIISLIDETNRPVAEVRAEDDGDVSSNAFPSKVKTISLSVPSLPEGVYKIDVRASRDIFIRSIDTTQQKLIFLNILYLADEVGYKETFSPVSFFTEAKRISAQTRHATGIQSVKIGSHPLEVATPFQLFTSVVSDPGLVPVVVEKGDLEMVFDSPIAFSRDQYFRPDPVRLLPHTNLDRLGINYLIAQYTSPEVINGWNVAKVHLNVPDLLFEGGSWKFTFSTPEITELNASLFVKEIDLELKK